MNRAPTTFGWRPPPAPPDTLRRPAARARPWHDGLRLSSQTRLIIYNMGFIFNDGWWRQEVHGQISEMDQLCAEIFDCSSCRTPIHIVTSGGTCISDQQLWLESLAKQSFTIWSHCCYQECPRHPATSKAPTSNGQAPQTRNGVDHQWFNRCWSTTQRLDMLSHSSLTK